MLTLIKAQGKANKVKQTTHNHVIFFFFLRKKSCESESPRYIYIYIYIYISEKNILKFSFYTLLKII